jgi:hypothetical protein
MMNFLERVFKNKADHPSQKALERADKDVKQEETLQWKRNSLIHLNKIPKKHREKFKSNILRLYEEFGTQIFNNPKLCQKGLSSSYNLLGLAWEYGYIEKAEVSQTLEEPINYQIKRIYHITEDGETEIKKYKESLQNQFNSMNQKALTENSN